VGTSTAAFFLCEIKKVTTSQDDDSVWGLQYSWLDMQEHERSKKVTGSQDDDFVGGLKKNLPQTGERSR
jgi:hypothetical protein